MRKPRAKFLASIVVGLGASGQIAIVSCVGTLAGDPGPGSDGAAGGGYGAFPGTDPNGTNVNDPGSGVGAGGAGQTGTGGTDDQAGAGPGTSIGEDPPVCTGTPPAGCSGRGVDRTNYDYGDRVPASKYPPGCIPISQAPMFVSIGFDDNEYSGLDGTAGTGGVQWVIDKLLTKKHANGQPVRFSFYMATTYGSTWYSESGAYVTQGWHNLLTLGQAIENHTVMHGHGGAFDAAKWSVEVAGANTFLTTPYQEGDVQGTVTWGVGVPPGRIYGFRTPFLEYDDALFDVLKNNKIWYDCSIEEGWEDGDGTGYLWPYTLDKGSPGDQLTATWQEPPRTPIGQHPGMWELPAHAVIVPPDSVASQYGVATGLRDKLKAAKSYFDNTSGKITGLDYNMWVEFGLTKAEFVATLKYTLDQRLKGNRAPMMFGAHSGEYSSKWSAPGVPASVTERQRAIEEFLDYALGKPEVRVRTMKEVLDWLRDPVPLNCL
jgi:hypothetical protein